MSDLRPIRMEADYEGALAEVERLWGAPAGTPDGDRLDVLATLIDVYEGERLYESPCLDPVRTAEVGGTEAFGLST
jgi:HTH-type transcriptional regulator/antitoxin HigA